jgi:hypothetical protein
MASEAVDQLMDKWLNEPGFKEQLLADPEATVQAAGWTLSDDDWAVVRNVVAGLGDQELEGRISKLAFTGRN